MVDFQDFDPGLFAPWPKEPVYDGFRAAYPVPGEDHEAQMLARVKTVLLEIKSRDAAPEDLRLLLNDMTVELRAQFGYFRDLRRAAEQIGLDCAEDAAAKLARADVKAATDAMSLIVRTLEKVDALQRQLARDRDLEAERQTDTQGLADARAHFLTLIDARAEERAMALFEQWKRDGPGADAGGPGSAAAAPEPG